MTATIKGDTFTDTVLQSDRPVLVDFWAPWCEPCQAVNPVIDELAIQYEGRAQIVKVNVDEAPLLAQDYGVSSIPCFLVFRGGEVRSRTIGVVSKNVLSSLLEAQLN